MTPGLAAVCPEHPEQPSVATCTRCGRFLCTGCRVSADPALCRTCAPLALDPLGILSTPFGASGTLRNGWRMFAPVLPQVLAIATVFSIPAGLISAGLADSGVGAERVVNLYDALIGLIGDIACLAMFVGVAEGRSLSLGQALKEGTGAWGRVFGARFRAGLITLAFTLLLIIPGIWKGVLLAFVVEAAYRVPGEDSLEYSTSLVQGGGRWWPVFGVLLLSGFIAYVPVFFGAAIMGGLAAVAAVPALNVAVEIGTDFIARIADNLLSAFSLATFYGLCKTDGRTLPAMQPQA